MGRRGRSCVVRMHPTSHSLCSDSQSGWMPQLWRSPLNSKRSKPQPGVPTWGRGGPITPGFANQWDLIWESWRAIENQGCALSKSQRGGSSLKNTWVTHEGDAFINFKACDGGRYLLKLSLGIEVLVDAFSHPHFFAFLPPSWHCQASFLTLSINLANTIHSILEFLWRLTCLATPSGWPQLAWVPFPAPTKVAPVSPHLVSSLSWHQCRAVAWNSLVWASQPAIPEACSVQQCGSSSCSHTH